MSPTLWLLLIIVACVMLLAWAGARRVQALDRRNDLWAGLAFRTPWQDIAFDPAMVADLPATAQRWLLSTITPGAPLRPVVEVSSDSALGSGEQRHTILSLPHGWVTRRYTKGFSDAVGTAGSRSLAERWFAWLVPLPPVPGAGGEERALIEAVLFAPASLLDPQVRWEQPQPGTITIAHMVGERLVSAEALVSDGGLVERVRTGRWSAIPRDFAVHSGVRIPTHVDLETAERAEVMRITRIRYLPPYKGSAHS